MAEVKTLDNFENLLGYFETDKLAQGTVEKID